MTDSLAFVGDIHGNLPPALGMWNALVGRKVPHVVFLGDYINRGTQSAEVLQMLLSQASSGHATLLAGNHEEALIDAIDREDLSGFLKMGGAPTIRSYVGGNVGADVLADLLAALPADHLQALRGMPTRYENEHVIAQHRVPEGATRKFQISAHVPVGPLPRISRQSAQLDTGCGSPSGRLTALLWPSLDYAQVDNEGEIVSK